MAKAEWGAKHTCLSCGAKFYDMGRNPIICPACDAPFAAAAPSRTRRPRKAEAKVVAVAAPVAVATTGDDKAASTGDDGESLIDGIDDLIDDDDDDEDDAVVALATDDDDDDDDVLAEADLSKNKISDE